MSSSSPDPRSPARGRDTARESAPAPAPPANASANAHAAPAHDRVVIHLDLDAFYAQVETKRLGLNPAQPLAVQQWQGIIAVNYPARDAGVRRHHTAAEARRLCPAIALVHVETIGDDEDNEERREETDLDVGGKIAGERPAAEAALADVSADFSSAANADTSADAINAASAASAANAAASLRSSRKVSLQRYRRASWEIMSTLADECATVERASIDEAYLDVTAEVDAALLGDADDVAAAVRRGVDASGAVAPLDPDGSALDRRLAIGADVCRRVREAVLAKTGFTMSGGVAHNKMLAKLASARNKPNKQTAVSRAATPEMLDSLPMRSVRGLGGKFGERVERLVVEHGGVSDAARTAASGAGRGSSYEGGFLASALGRVPSDVFRREFDAKTADWLARVSVGDDIEPVVSNVRDGAKSLCAFKSFAAVSERGRVHRWLRVLSRELAERLVEDRLRSRRAPKLLRLEYRAELKATHLRDWKAGRVGELTEMRSKSFGFPKRAANAVARAATTTTTTTTTGVTTETRGAGKDDDDEARRRAAAESAESADADAADATREAADAIADAAIAVFDAQGRATMPCTRVGLAASDFVATPSADGGIAKFFGTATTTTKSKSRSETRTEPEPGPVGEGSRPGAEVVRTRADANAAPRGLDRFFARRARDDPEPVEAEEDEPTPTAHPGTRNADPEDDAVRAILDDAAEETAAAAAAGFETDARGRVDGTFPNDGDGDGDGDGDERERERERERVDFDFDFDVDAFVVCARCGARVARGRDAQEHEDEHVAFDLARDEPQHRVDRATTASRRAAVGGGSKRKRAARGNADGGGARGARPIDAFFVGGSGGGRGG